FSLAFIWIFLLFFFFQAEDGIRDRSVTGVQTCALPISNTASTCPGTRTLRHSWTSSPAALNKKVLRSMPRTLRPYMFLSLITSRSEERRVGKEGRSICAKTHNKDKKCKYDDKTI